MQEKTVLVSGKEVRFRSSAAIPRLAGGIVQGQIR